MKLEIKDNENEVLGEIRSNFEFNADIPLEEEEEIRSMIRSAKKFKVDVGPLERHSEDDPFPITPGEAFTTFEGEQALKRLKNNIDKLTRYHAEIVEEEDVALKYVEDPQNAPDDVDVKEGPPGHYSYTVNKDEVEGDNEMLEIRDHYRVWVEDKDSVPADRTTRYDEAGDSAGNHWYYELPFETSTRIDLSDESAEPDHIVEKDNSDLTPESLLDFGVSEHDRNLYKSAVESIQSNDELFDDPYDTLEDVESPITLLSLYKMCFESDRYEDALTPIQNELRRRGIAAVDKISKKRRILDGDSSDAVSLEKSDYTSAQD